jgi:hypothetical protein
VNSAVAGGILQGVTRDPHQGLEEVIEKYYRPRTAQAGKGLADIFFRIEEGYFGRWDSEAIENAHNLDVPGEFMGWGLFGEEPETPNHLCEPFLDKEARMSYKDELIGCLKDLEKIQDSLESKNRAERIEDAQITKATNGPGQAHH